ncbi:hypothetical protein QFX18_19135 [Saccharophagus degradans]|uniref:hypothetical protein n=1 Tax=Saccharophagus degradans TaxID=86304 RepID=UPI002477FD14|nr:hypothetical protein [Saccharophagus degradans]WGO98124.1 hypothetical protein QFX18_19135 [Saccharophagus degradans]
MELDARDILRVLRQKGVEKLHHANTVRTACSFLRQGKLISRGTLDELGLPQTDQQTDEIDKDHGLWYDIFVDTVNIHHRGKGRNLYGPILFEFNLEILEQDWLPYIWVTKTNPNKWTNDMNYEEKYFKSVGEFEANFQYGNFDKLFVLRSVGGVVRLAPYLNRIIVDRCERELYGVKAYDQAVGAIKASAIAGGLEHVEIAPHGCQQNCKCESQYTTMNGSVFEKFYKP